MLVVKNFPGYFLLGMLFVVLYFLLTIFQPFVITFILSAVIVTVTFPAYRWIKKGIKNDGIASLLMTFLITLVVLFPIIFLVSLLITESIQAFELFRDNLNSGYFDQTITNIENLINNGILHLSPYINLQAIDVSSEISSALQGIISFLVNQSVSLAGGILQLVLNLLLLLLITFYLFKDGRELLRYLAKLSPLTQTYDREIFKKFNSISKASIYGIFFTAIIQGIVGGIGFAIFGIPSPVLWGTMMAFFSLIPYVGTAIVWVPTLIVLLLMGNYFTFVLLGLWCAILVSSADNLIRAYLIQGQARMHSLLTFLSLLGGVLTFGLVGLIVGPLILMLTLTVLHIYTKEYYNPASKA